MPQEPPVPGPLPGAHGSLARDQTEGTHTPGHSLAAAATSSSLVLISDSVDADAMSSWRL